MAVRLVWVAALAAAALRGQTGAVAGPVEDKPADAEDKQFPLPGRGSEDVPVSTLRAVEDVRELLTQQPDDVLVTLSDLDKVEGEQVPPQRYVLPADFQPEEVPAVAVKKLTDYLPTALVALLPSLPSLSLPHLPSFIPGVDFSASVHTPAASLPHVPSPTEVVRGVSHLVDNALHRLYHREEQLVELIKCACPRPARCESLFHEISVHGAPAFPHKTPAVEEEAPAVSVFAELTRPHGEHGPSLGFYVDSHGPHLGRPHPAGDVHHLPGEEAHHVQPPPPPPPEPASTVLYEEYKPSR